MKVSYLDNPDRAITVNQIHAWGRGEIEPTMSASSGPKGYIRNHVWAIFEDYPAVARVLLVRGEYSRIGKDEHPSPPFLLLVDGNGQAWDMAGKPVVMEA
jgi:hypothetical protein